MRSLPIRWPSKVKFASAALFVLTLFGLVGTPGFTQAQAAVVLPPVFSVPRGFFSSKVDLTLSAASGTTIRYTTNGSAPTPSTGTVYAANSKISFTKTTVVRAIAYTSATAKSAVTTNTYIFLNSVRAQPDTRPSNDWPEQFAATDDVGSYPSDYGMDPEVLDHSNNAGKFESVMKSLPSLSVVTDLPNLWDPGYGIYYNSNAKEDHEDYPTDPYNNPVSPGKWERPVSLEWINPDGSMGFQIDGGLRMHGQASRRPKRTPKHSFRVYFKKGYGVGNLDFQLFSDATAVGKFDRLVLRNGGNRSYPYFDRDQRREADYVNDEWARQAWEDMGHLAPHGTYVHLYLNGLYWGLYNVAERIDEKYLAAYHSGLLETDFDLIESEEEQDDNAVASAGDMTAYKALLAAVSPMSTTPISNDQYNQIKQMVDVENLADYFIHVNYIGKTDWPDHNWNVYRARVGSDTRFKFIAWDNDSGLNKVLQDTTLMTETLTYPYVMGPEGRMVPDTSQPLMYDAPLQIFKRLTTNAEFRQIVTDRFFKHVVDPTGTLAPAHCVQMYTELTGMIDQAIIGESARWGDYSRDKYPSTNLIDQFDKPFPAYLYSRDLPTAYTDPTNAVADDVQKTWLQVRTEKLNTYCPNRSNVVLSQYKANGWYVAPLNVPGISQRGGTVPVAPSNKVTLNNTLNNGAGDIYYTTNGVDPRAEFGTLAAGATLASGAGADSATITIARATTVMARVRNGNNWSPLLEYVFAPTQSMANLVINEIHYLPAVPTANPPLDAKQYEFIELFNSGTTPLQLDRVSFARGVTYQFPANTDIQAGQYLVLASNANTFQGRYKFAPWGVFSGSLANEGEPVELLDAVGNSFDRVDFKPVAPWPSLLAPNAGKSLSLYSPTLDNALPANWRVSNIVDGTPGAPNGHTAQGQQVPAILWTTPFDITYGEPLSVSQLNATISGAPGDAGGTFTYDPPLGTVLQAGYGQLLRVTFTPNDSTKYAPSTATTMIDVERAPLTVTADSKVWRTSTPFPALTATYAGFVNGDNASVLDTPPILSTTATPSSPLGVYPISVANGVDNNYTMTVVDGTLTVTDKAIPSISWSPAGLTYGTPLGAAQLNATASENGQPVPGTFTYNQPLGTVLTAGTHALSVTFTPADAGTYIGVSLNITLEVAKAPLVIKAANKSKQVGTANPPLTATYAGFVNGDDASVLDTPALLSTSASADSPVGVYPITVSGATDRNYAITFVNGTLTVSAEPVAAPEHLVFLPLVEKR